MRLICYLHVQHQAFDCCGWLCSTLCLRGQVQFSRVGERSEFVRFALRLGNAQLKCFKYLIDTYWLLTGLYNWNVKVPLLTPLPSSDDDSEAKSEGVADEAQSQTSVSLTRVPTLKKLAKSKFFLSQYYLGLLNDDKNQARILCQSNIIALFWTLL